jgi:hypothetical protein
VLPERLGLDEPSYARKAWSEHSRSPLSLLLNRLSIVYARSRLGYRRDFEKALILASHVAGVSTRINRTGRGDDPTFSVRVVACPMLGEAILRTRKRVRPESGKPTPCRWSR